MTPSLHPRVLKTQSDEDFVSSKLSAMTRARPGLQPKATRAAAAGASVGIPLVNVAQDLGFDAHISITYRDAKPDFSVSLLLDTGNSTLIVPDFSAIATLPNFCSNYTVLRHDAQEPWKCPACIVRGPIIIPIDANTAFAIPDCVFYACTGPNEAGERTANFGAGCITPWSAGNNDGVQSPLSYRTDYPFAEFNYASAAQMFAAGNKLNVSEGSSLNLYRSAPAGYQMLEIVKSSPWMSVRPKALTIGSNATGWPGALMSTSIAMVDTGGGPVFLSDPRKYVWAGDWADATPAPLPSWTSGSFSCQSISGNLTIALIDDRGNEFSYQIDPAKLPPPLQSLSLVMCATCDYMRGEDGMNIGGLSVLFNHILVDYASARVGFKPKAAELI